MFWMLEELFERREGPLAVRRRACWVLGEGLWTLEVWKVVGASVFWFVWR